VTVRITSPVLGKAVNDPYTGPLESWLINEGYATIATSVPDAWAEDSDGILGAFKPDVTVTPTAAKLVGSANAVNQTVTGVVVFGTKGGVRTSVSLTSGDTPAQAATKIDTALSGKADAAIVSNKLEVTSTATGPAAFVTVVGGDTAVLADLKLAVNDTAHGGDGRPAGASNTGAQAAPQVDDPTVAENREKPYWPLTPDTTWTIANDVDNLTEEKFPNPAFDFDKDVTPTDGNDADDDAPSDVTVTPSTGLASAGGTVLTFEAPNNNLLGVTSVTFGGTAGTALDVSKAADGELKVTTPPKAAGTYTVVLVDPSGNLTLTNAVTFV